MNILYLGSFFPDSRYSEIVRNSLDVIQNAGDAYQKALVAGLSEYVDSYSIITSPMIGSYPTRYSERFFKGSTFEIDNQENCICCGFDNLTLYKNYSRYFSINRELKKWTLNNNGSKYIILYSLDLSLLKAACELKKRDKEVKICLIITDLFRYMLPPNNFLGKFALKYFEIKSKDYYKHIDSFVLMTEFMKYEYEINEDNYVVVEGLYNTQRNFNMFIDKESHKTILYSGIIAKQFGIIHLLDAFSVIKNSDYRLWICGDGDGKDEVLRRVNEDSRIKYFGQIKREEVLKLQRRATVLVNPRFSNEEFTLFSFPSKTMEYMASGTPTIMHPLKCLPQEYLEHLFIAYDESDMGLATTIIDVCERSKEELDLFGKKASNFIVTKKNSKVQVKKILDMIGYEK